MQSQQSNEIQNNHQKPFTPSLMQQQKQFTPSLMQHYHAKKESLIKQILSYTNRVAQYQTLAYQLKTVSSVIQKSQTPGLSNSASQKLISTKKIDEELTVNSKKQKMQRRVCSSKKIKIYELQKKLYRLNKQHNQKYGSFMFEKRQLQVTKSTAIQLGQFIKMQTKRNKQLNEEMKQVEIQNNLVDLEQKKSKEQSDDKIKKKETYLYEKNSLLTYISSLQAKIKQLQNNLFTSSQEIKSPKQCDTEFKTKIGSTKSNQNRRNEGVSNIYKIGKRQQQEIEYEIIESNNSVFQIPSQNLLNLNQQNLNENDFKTEIGRATGQFDNQRKEFVTLSQYNKQPDQNDKKFTSNYPKATTIGISTQPTEYLKSLNYPQSLQNHSPKDPTLNYQTIFHQVKDKAEILSQNNSQSHHHLFLQHKQIIAIQTHSKHLKINIDLLNNKIKTYDLFIKRQTQKHLSNINKIQLLKSNLSLKQGYRGQIRGQIGTIVQQQALIRILNQALKKDLNQLQQKTLTLTQYKNLLSALVFKTHNAT